ncbi:unnamed protein product [Adineta ricciae]|uniref:Uncharacterized protein n=1 Tax=Adineta ricciae TaxID=249248 RepID=A0A814XPM8_ADIRI|nr:unnamed protein product [Adineta ricciae]
MSNTGSVDLESVLNVCRRTLASIGEKSPNHYQPYYTDTIYLKREDSSNSLLSIESKVLIFGELQLLYSIFERYTSNITIYEDESPTRRSSSPPLKKSFSTVDEDDVNDEGLPVVSTLRKTSIASSKGSTSPPKEPGSPVRKKLNSIGRSQTVSSLTSTFSSISLEGKNYGCIELPNTSIIEILEILLRTRMDLVDVSSDYNDKNVLYQNFVFSKTRPVAQKPRQTLSRSTSFAGS